MAKSKKKPREMLLVTIRVKNYVREKRMQCAPDLIEVLNERVYLALDRAIRRAQANERKTARGFDVDPVVPWDDEDEEENDKHDEDGAGV